MIIALAGGTGFTGQRVAHRLSAGGHQLRCLVRATSDHSCLPAEGEAIVGDLSDVASLNSWLAGCDSLVYLASMGLGHVPALVVAAEQAGIRRALFVSTTGIFTRLSAPSKRVRLAAEDAVKSSRGLAWTIVRPTMIYGAPGDRNMERLLRLIARSPVLPVPGAGRALIQPTHVEDLADGIVAALSCVETIGQTYELSGLEPVPFAEALRIAQRTLARPEFQLRLPLSPVVMGLKGFEAMGLRLPIKSEQVLRLAEDKAFPHTEASRTFGYAPRGLAAGLFEEARLLGLIRRLRE